MSGIVFSSRQPTVLGLCYQKKHVLECKVYKLLGSQHVTLRLKLIVHLNLLMMPKKSQSFRKAFFIESFSKCRAK